MTTPDIQYYIWHDFETTGLDLILDQPVEAAFVVTDTDCNIIQIDGRPAIRQAVFWPDNDRLWKNPVVKKMHEDSGLMQDIFAARTDTPNYGQVQEFLTGEVTDMLYSISKARVYRFAGSGVERYDRHILDTYWPAWLTTWNIDYRDHDVSNVRTWFKDNGFLWLIGEEESASEHRALADCLRSIALETRMRDWLMETVRLAQTTQAHPLHITK